MPSLLRELLCFLKAVIVLLVILILMTPLFIWCLTVKILAKLFKPNFRQMYDLNETFFLMKDQLIHTNPEMVNTVCLKLKIQELTVEDIKLQVYQKLLNVRRKTDQSLLMYEKLQQHPVHFLGYTFHEWDRDFDINQHIRVVKNYVGNVDQFIADQIGAPFQENCSPWDLVFAPKFGGISNCSMILLRFHHSLCDAFSMMEIVNSFLGIQTQDASLLFQSSAVPGENWRQKMARFYGNTIKLPFLFSQAIDVAAKSNVEGIIRNNLQFRKDKTFVATTRSRISLKDFDRMSKSLGIPFTAIINVAISNVMHRYDTKNFGSRRMLEDSRLWHLFPLSGRPDSELKNWLGSTSMETSAVNEPLATQLASAKKEYESAKETWIAHLANHYISQVLFGSLPSALYLKLLGDTVNTFATVVNVRGPSECQTFLNNPVEDMISNVSPTSSTGPIFSITSYNGYVKVGVSDKSSRVQNLKSLRGAATAAEEELRRIFELAYPSTANGCGEISHSSSDSMTIIWV